TVSGAGADPASPVGTYVLVPALVDPTGKVGNYAVTLNNGTLTITPASLAVTVANATRAYGDPNPAFNATFSGLRNADNITATFASAGPTAAIGSYPITASLVDPGAKLGNYSLTLTNGTLTVAPAALSVSAANASRLYGDANPVFTGTLTGVKNAENITAAFASAALITSPVGSFAIVPTLADPTSKLGNYTVTSTNGTLLITAAPLNVSSDSASRLYGDPNPAFTGSVTGQKNADIITATFDSAAVATSPVGQYPIVATLADPGSKLTNYTVVSNSGTLTVGPVALTVTAANASRLYGDSNPAFSGTIVGLRNADNITATFTSAPATAAIGVYPITPVLADPTSKLGNYTVTSNNGALTVNAAALSVTAANASRPYGAANPVFAGNIVGIKNADNITATFSSAANTASAVGTYSIIPALLDPTSKLGNYTVTSSNGTLTVTQAQPVVSLAVQAALPNSQLTAQVQNTGPALPTGTVQFFDGGVSLGAPVALAPVGGVAQATLTSALTTGGHSITAAYSGDATYTASTSAPVPVTVGNPPQFGLTGTGGNTSATVAAGKDAVFNISLAPQGFTGTINFTCSGSPSGTTCTVNPNPLTVSSPSANVPVTVTVSGTQNARMKPVGFKVPFLVFAGVLAGLASGFSKKRRKLVLVAMAAFMISGLAACGGGTLQVSNGGGGGGGGSTSSTLTVVGTSGTQSASIKLTLTITH
ncbi:MAG: MBG domain-containing protein, partial [Terriglobales bacterium]